VMAAAARMLCLPRPLLFPVDLPLQVTGSSAVVWCLGRPLLLKDPPPRAATTAATWSLLLTVLNPRHGHLTHPPAMLQRNCPPTMAAVAWV
jgi:hypothetical protein